MRKLFLLLAVLLFAATAHATTYYIDYASGSNSNAGTSKGAPWKSHPYMQQGAGCGGATHSYTHANGDRFIFKGGVSWPAACFVMTIATGGASGAVDYYGVDTTWFSGGSFTQPKFDMANAVPTGNNVTTFPSAFGGYVTFDDLEIANQGITIDGGGVNGVAFQFDFVTGSNPGVTIQYVNMHDWTSNTDVATLPATGPGSGWTYSSGCINDGHDHVVMDHSICDDTNGYVFHSGVKTNGGWGGACGNCGTVENSTFRNTFAACFTVLSCHDNEMTGIKQTTADLCPCRPHSQVVEDDFGAISGMKVYNNYVHDNNPVGVTIYVNYSALVYNNVMKNNSNGNIMIGHPGNGYSSLTGTGYVLNNTVDGSNGQPCFQTDALSKGTSPGPLVRNNNICVTNGTEINIVSAITTFTNGPNNYKMPTSEAAAFGFVSSGKYSPSSADSNVVAKGTNYTSSCSGGLSALCQDASGAPWFGGSYKTRPTGSTGWDLGAYQGQGGGGNLPPAVTFTSPSPGTVSGTQTLTVTATPQGSATISSCQFTIDGFTFGSPDTSSPYTKSWDTTTAANAQHVLNATCTDSNGQTGSASPTVTVTVSNSIPGCFISTDNSGTTPLSWTGNQSIGTQSANFSFTVQLTPNTASQNSVTSLSQNAITAYSQAAALLRANPSGNWDAWNDAVAGYAAVNTAPAVAGITYSFTWTLNFTGPNAGSYSINETSPSSIVIATNYTFRSTASFASLGVITAAGINDTPDTVKVCNAQVGSATSLTFSPSSVNLGNVNVGSTASQTVTATSAGGATTFTSVTGLSGDLSIFSNGCTGSQTSCTTVVHCTPSASGLISQVLSYADNATGSPQTVNVSCTGIPTSSSATPSPTSINFGNVQIGPTCPPSCSTSGPVTMTLANGPITFGSPAVTFDNPDFSVASSTCAGSVSASSCQITPKFIPSVIGNETATMTIHDDAPSGGSTQTVSLVGTGVNFPVPAPATQFVFQDNFPVTFTIRGKTYTYIYTGTCNCQWANSKWGCVCQ